MSSGILFLVVWACALPAAVAVAHFGGKAQRWAVWHLSVAALGAAWLLFTASMWLTMTVNYHHVDGAVGWAAERDMFLDIFATGAGMFLAIVCSTVLGFKSYDAKLLRAEAAEANLDLERQRTPRSPREAV